MAQPTDGKVQGIDEGLGLVGFWIVVGVLGLIFLTSHVLEPRRRYPFNEAILVDLALPEGSRARTGTCTKIEKPTFGQFGCHFDFPMPVDAARSFFDTTLPQRGWNVTLRTDPMVFCRPDERLTISWNGETSAHVLHEWRKNSQCGQ
jgi:hypothetical protein